MMRKSEKWWSGKCTVIQQPLVFPLCKYTLFWNEISHKFSKSEWEVWLHHAAYIMNRLQMDEDEILIKLMHSIHINQFLRMFNLPSVRVSPCQSNLIVLIIHIVENNIFCRLIESGQPCSFIFTWLTFLEFLVSESDITAFVGVRSQI